MTQGIDYFEQLYTADSPSRELRSEGLQAADADQLSNEILSSLIEARDNCWKLKKQSQ